MKKLILTACILAGVAAHNANAFGSKGHRAVADIAEQYLAPKTSARITKIIGQHSLAHLATWADTIKSDPAWSACSRTWHYYSIDDHDRFPADSLNPKGDILAALDNFEQVLSGHKGQDPYLCQSNNNKGKAASPQWQALAFYIHFAADIHQPLHVGRVQDRGGNNISVKWFKDDSNLHSVWDTKMIEHMNLSYTEYSHFINHPTDNQLAQWQCQNHLDWAKESKAVRSQLYDYGPQKKSLPELSYQYIYKNSELLNQRVLQAGIRLADKLNQIFGDKSC